MSTATASFRKYPSIENSYQKSFVDQVKLYMPDYEPRWVVQEKLHGANFSITYDDSSKNISFNRRNGRLEVGEKFYNYETIVSDLTEKMMNLVRLIPIAFQNSLTVFGEIIGGHYPGEEECKTKPVQKGVDYCNRIVFVVFDLRTDDDFMNSTTARMWLNVAGFHLVPEIKICDTLEEALAVPIDFSSKMPWLLGMPPHPGSNICEGIVIRPRISYFHPDGKRAMLKKKNVGHSERKLKSSSQKRKEKFPDVLNYINVARLSSVRSKLKEDANIGEIGKAMIKDIIEDYLKDHEIEDVKTLRKEVSRKAFDFTKYQILNS